MTAQTVHDQIVIREAAEGDFDWVSGLMVQALTPYYNGDHQAHARRIFDTHMAGGDDHVGHFSAGQHMFIAEIGGERVGVIHFVEKLQGTVKISPLIVDPEHRGAKGVGTALLNHVEQMAVERYGARQLYCTVAAPNESALGFFLRHGFRITGTAHGHYKPGIDEHALYKVLTPDSGYDAPHVSVIEFVEETHGPAVRELIKAGLSPDFNGVDDGWVDALFRGYTRRESNDPNQKYKIIYVAESGGEVIGVVGATPKKGDPIKLMPLVADNEDAFEALIIDVQTLLAEYGHKLYVHLVPKPWQIQVLQQHGWKLEGVFPGGYSEESVVQQWGLSIKKEGGKVVERLMRIKGPYLEAIRTGRKTVEVRVGYNSMRKISVGDIIRFESSQRSVRRRVTRIQVFVDFESLLEAYDWRTIAPDAGSQRSTMEILRRIYTPDKVAYGIYVFELEPVD